jgi:endonuclease G
MCPSADRTNSRTNNDATFLMSNIIPQAPDNNQGLWADLENYSRAIAASNEVLVICGPQGFGSAVTASSGQIPIASNVWKIIVAVPLGGGTALSRITNSTRVIAVNIPNIQGIRTDPWQNYMTSVNQLQTNTGFNFFTTLNTNLATILRAKVDGSPATGVTNITPTGGSVGSSVVLRGTNFTGTTTVWFNGQAATFTMNSANQITATVPPSATTGPLSVIAAGGISTTSNHFTVNSVPVPQPTLTIAISGGSVVLSWPTNAVGYNLQQTAALNPAIWTNYIGSVTTNGTNKTVTLTTPSGSMFFRLSNP